MASIEKRTSDQGHLSYRVKVRLKGYPAQSATFARLTDARKWAQHTESAIREGRHFKFAEAKKHTLTEAIDRYIKIQLPRKGSQMSNQKAQLLWWKQTLGVYLLSDVTPSLIAESRDKLADQPTHQSEKRSPATVNRYLAALSHVLTIATNEWGWLEDSPMRKVNKLREPRGRVRFLSDDERERLLEACRKSKSPFLYPVVVLALSTGMRLREVLNLRWPDVDMNRGTLVLHETKNGERRVVPLTGHALSLIKEHSRIRRLDTELLFPGRNPQKQVDIRAAWLSAIENAKIKNFRFHDLRHSSASYLAMNGASLAEIAEVLGHKTLQMVKRYAHLSEAHTSRVVASMNAKIFGQQQ